MPYEKIVNINSLEIAPDESFFKHTEFYSSLNQSNTSFEIYENMKYLYETLKMRNLGDMNDLYKGSFKYDVRRQGKRGGGGGVPEKSDKI